MTGSPRVFGIVEMRRLDAPHPRLVWGMRFFEVVHIVIGADVARIVHEFVGHPTQRLDLGRAQYIRENDKSVATVGGEVGLREHGSSVGVQ